MGTRPRVAVIFDNSQRPETTGVYCRRALAELTDVEHFLPSELDQLEPGDFELYFYVDDGLDYPLADHLHPAAWWAIDTHMNFEREFNKAQQSDFTFAAQRRGRDDLQAAGIADPIWLPLACDPTLHSVPENVPETVISESNTTLKGVPPTKEHDICFVGNIVGDRRADMIHQLKQTFPNMFVGRRYFQEMASVYAASKIVFNCSVADDINMRVFEALCSGTLLLTNDLPGSGLDELFQEGTHFVTYSDVDELIDKARWYLEHESEREQIAAYGQSVAIKEHTYQRRMQTLLEHVFRGNTDDSTTDLITNSEDTDFLGSPPPKEAAYFSHARPEVLAMVPKTARQVLDVGCGAGYLGAAIKRRQSAHVIGIECVPAVAEMARQQLDDVICANLESSEIEFPEGRFDCVVCADILEHLRQPEKLLARIRQWLVPEGTLVASIPNVQHHSVISGLLSGDFTYEPAGLLDADHVRLFTRREIEKLLYRAHFSIAEMSFVVGPGDEKWIEEGRPGTANLGPLSLEGLPDNLAEQYHAYQYLVKAISEPDSKYGLTSIILVTHNQLSFTRQCLESLRFLTDEPYELIVVDNGSTDGTVDYLGTCDDVCLIQNSENRGFPAAVNQGLKAAQGENLLLLNNDTVLTTGWLRRLLDSAFKDDTIGLVGPVSNNISGEQQIPVGYSKMTGLDGFAWELSKQHLGQTVLTDRLVGFCMLIKRRVYERIGGFDERFGIGNFEDDDFCRRAIDDGFQCVIARDAFVHHFGSATFRASGVNFAQILEENQQKYIEKWDNANRQPEPQSSKSAPNSAVIEIPKERETQRRSPFSLTTHPAGGLLLQKQTIGSSLCMIVRDNAQTIGPALESIRPWVDEIIVVDTGSVDETPDICQSLGARLFEFPWCDDFSAARNASLQHAQGEWIFWMDSDDTITTECGQRLKQLVNGEHPSEVFGYVMQVHCPSSNEDVSHDVTIVDHVKLFRNRPDLRFEGRIHEQIIPAIRRAGGEVAFTDIYVVHSGSDHSPAGHRGKIERDLRILHRELEDLPHHPFVLFNLGMTYADDNRHDEAIDYLRKCLEVTQPNESHLRKAYALLVNSLSQSDRHQDAWEICKTGLELFPDDKELLFRSGLLHHHFGRLAEAIRAYQQTLQKPKERHFSSVDNGIGGYKARHNLALVYEESGDLTNAERQWNEVIKENPGFQPAWRGVGELLLKRGRFDAAITLAHRARDEFGLMAESAVLLAKTYEVQGFVDRAIEVLSVISEDEDTDYAVLREQCRITFERFSPADAEEFLLKLTQCDPTDASAQHNLAIAYLQTGRAKEAVAACHYSLKLRPESISTRVQLAYALRDAGDLNSAISTLEEGRRIDPSHHSLQQAWRDFEENGISPSGSS